MRRAADPAFFTCANGTNGLFCFQPNPGLRPEVGKNKEAGLNLKYDNIFSQGDSFRGKFNAFRNDLEDYIEGHAAHPDTDGIWNIQQIHTIPEHSTRRTSRVLKPRPRTTPARGSSAVAAQYQRGFNDDTSFGLVNIQPNKVATTFGLRSPDRTVTLAGTWVSAASNQNINQLRSTFRARHTNCSISI